jgi:transcription antitermination factor NusG
LTTAQTITTGPIRELGDIPASFRAGPLWFAIRTNIRCERRAQLGLDALGYRTYLPQCIRWVSHARVKERVRRPLFARYIFVEFDINMEGTDGIRNTHGVEGILGNAGVPMTVPGALVVDLLGRELKGEFDETKDQKLPIGAKIAIMDGQHDGLIAVLCGGNNGHVICRIVDSARETKLPLASVRAA